MEKHSHSVCHLVERRHFDLHEQTGKVFRTLMPLPPGQTRALVCARIRFDHCRTEDGQWDTLRISNETFAECGFCAGRIEEKLHKSTAADLAEWLPTAIGEPGVVSQHHHDLLSKDANSSWGEIVLKFLAVKNDRKELQGWFNHALGIDTTDEETENDENDIRNNMGLRFKRGTVPWENAKLVLGSDIGQSHARWVVCAIRPEDGAIAVVDWGNFDSPGAVAELVMNGEWPVVVQDEQTGAVVSGKRLQIEFALMDAKYRKIAAQEACLATNGIMFPAMGGGANTQRRPFTWNTYEKGMPKWFGYFTFNTHEAKSCLYLDRYKKRSPGIFFPHDVFRNETSERFVEEITKESLVTDPETEETEWDDKHPNHYGAALVNCDLAYRWLAKKRTAKHAREGLKTADQIADAMKARAVARDL